MVSVVIPAFNAERTIRQCLESVKEQSYNQLEIIVVDDGSTDNTYRICKQFLDTDPRFHLIQQENKGVSSARNRGLFAAQGEYVLLVDADDVLVPKATELLVSAMHDDIDLVIGSHMVFRGKYQKSVLLQQRTWTRKDIEKDFYNFDILLNAPWGRLYRKNVLVEHNIQFRENLRLGEDHVFNLDYCKIARKVCVIPDVVCKYRLGGMASSVRYYPNKAELNMALLEHYFIFFDGVENVPEFFLKKKIKDQFTGSVAHFLTYCDRKTAHAQIEATFALFSPFLTEKYVDRACYNEHEISAYHSKDCNMIIRAVWQIKWKRILARRLKIWYYGKV